MDLDLAARRVRGRLTPALGRGRCYHCHLPWGDGDRDSHGLKYKPGHKMFITCKWCWPITTTRERLHYATDIVYRLWTRPEDWPLVEKAILDAGGVLPHIP